MPRNILTGIIIGCAITLAAGFYTNKPKIYIHPNLKISENSRWTTVEEIEQSLRNSPPMNIGFDIDDTVLFTKTSFHLSYKKFCPTDTRMYRPSCGKQQKYWDEVNNSGKYASAKSIGKNLIEMHKQRGDKIFFITAREKSKYIPENLSKTLRDTFNLDKNQMPNVIYLGIKSADPNNPGKTASIISNNIKVFYGDSDSDIAAAKKANIRGIRVMRAPNSHDNQDMPLNGRYGEEVIIGSDI